MSRSGYSFDLSNWSIIRWRGAVKSAIRGKRGQAFLREMKEALEALPERRLASSVLVEGGECCAMGAVALKRSLDVSGVDPYNRTQVANLFNISKALAAEIAFENDQDGFYNQHTPEERWRYMHRWVTKQIKENTDGEG